MPVSEVPATPGPASTPAPNQPASPSPSAEPAAPSPEAKVKPDGLPDKYWDKEAGLRVSEVVQTLSALDADNAKQAETFKDFPKDAKDAGKFYTLPEQMLPEGMELPKGLVFEPDKQLLETVLPVAHKHKLAPEAFHDLVRTYNAIELARFQDAQAQFAEDGKKLGANAAARRKAVADGLAALIGPEKAKFVDAGAITSGAVEFFEAILARATTQGNVIPLNQKRDETAPEEKTFGPGERIFSSMRA